jgi:hypothetical protein
MKKLQPRHYVYALLLILILGSFTSASLLWTHQQDEISTLNSEVSSLTANQAATQGPTYNDVTIAPTDSMVYFPLAKLKVASSTLAEGLVYTYTPSYTIPHDSKVFPSTISISTHDLAANAQSTTQQFDCTEVAYADFVTPSYPVNPMWKSDGSVKLADGRTMNVYYAPSIPGCSGAWRLNDVNSKAIADVLKSAISY